MELDTTAESWPMIRPFRIAYRTIDSVDLIVVKLTENAVTGCGEAIGVNYHGETPESMLAQIESARSEIEAGISRSDLTGLLPAGGARNALDCALWDLECKAQDESIWSRLSIQPRLLQTVYTIGIDTLDGMAANAAASSEAILKIKINAESAIDQVKAVRTARPGARLIVDANQAFSLDTFMPVAVDLAQLGVEMIEQPLPAGEDGGLSSYISPVPLCADESCLTSDDVPFIKERYQIANIKLDKTGGLTGALDLADRASKAGMDLMVGCMAGTSLSMAPAYVIGQSCIYVDIDGPLLQVSDRDNAMIYERGHVSIPDRRLWG